MRRTGDLWHRILERENLRLAVVRALQGKRDRQDAREFAAQLDTRLATMAAQLRAGTFPVGRYHQFVVHDPKERIITAPRFVERVLHHAMINVCEGVFERWLIADTYACRRGKGREAAVQRARYFARRYPCFLKLDVRKYFDSIPHEHLLARLERLFKDRAVLDLFTRVVRCFRGDLGCGLPIGSLTSQHLANFYLGWFDRFVKEHLRLRGYVRYMDDMALWGNSTNELREVLARCQEFLTEELGLELKPNSHLNRTAHGMDFLGCRIYPTHVVLNRRSRQRFRSRLIALEEAHANGELSESELQQRATALVAFAHSAGAASWRFRTRVLQELVERGHEARTG